MKLLISASEQHKIYFVVGQTADVGNWLKRNGFHLKAGYRRIKLDTLDAKRKHISVYKATKRMGNLLWHEGAWVYVQLPDSVTKDMTDPDLKL